MSIEEEARYIVGLVRNRPDGDKAFKRIIKYLKSRQKDLDED